ncbi:MAG: hypothetical protein PWR10_541 [Halanaerobiales bacterium]|nr:hypothetical protein [Halanaerobiales bacterium]
MERGLNKIYKLIKSKLLIDGTGGEVIDAGQILIKDGVIEKTGSPGEMGDIPENAEVVDLSDYYILPGLIDSHTHLSIVPGEGNQLEQMRLPAGKGILRSIPNIYKNIKSGVTTARIMGEENYIDIDIKEAIEQKLIQGPRLLVSGRGVVATNGHGVAHTVADGPDEVRKLCRQNLARGADLIKIFVTGGVSSRNSTLDFCGYTLEEVAAAVEEAERAGTYVAAHAHGGRGADLCIQQGVRSIEHGAFINEEQLESIIKKDMWIVGTFTILFHPEGIEKTDFNVPQIREKVLSVRETVAKNFERIIKSGANLAIGTDSMHGFIGFEMECLVDFGASNMEAILAATRNAARACRVEDKLGTLETGKLADFIALAGNPLEDIKHIRKVEFVFKEGEMVNIEGIGFDKTTSGY